MIFGIGVDVLESARIAQSLERFGARVVPAGGAAEAFELLERTPDVAAVLMDMMMPEIDG